MSDVDLPSFTLLRIDQIHIHDTTTLIEPEAQLTALENEEAMESISQFVSKLLVHIRTEGDGQSKQMRDDNVNSKESGCNAEKSMPIPSTSSFVSSKRINKTPHRLDRR